MENKNCSEHVSLIKECATKAPVAIVLVATPVAMIIITSADLI